MERCRVLPGVVSSLFVTHRLFCFFSIHFKWGRVACPCLSCCHCKKIIKQTPYVTTIHAWQHSKKYDHPPKNLDIHILCCPNYSRCEYINVTLLLSGFYMSLDCLSFSGTRLNTALIRAVKHALEHRVKKRPTMTLQSQFEVCCCSIALTHRCSRYIDSELYQLSCCISTVWILVQLLHFCLKSVHTWDVCRSAEPQI